ncbi:ionotropic receptor 75a-like [Schistocerca nitens]|uniref:ionotropic receptor 75a-like n=1 Tax=Schistocerca nitens TaxID=7011 RepID=UPI002118DE14|nr:ionotropic receptor 75a-like [Schistocerca nitens]
MPEMFPSLTWRQRKFSASARRMFGIQRHWLLVDTAGNRTADDEPEFTVLPARSRHLLAQLFMMPDSEVVWMGATEDGEIQLLDVYRLTSFTSVLNISLAGWAVRRDSGVSLYLLPRPDTSKRRNSLHGAKLKAGAAILFPKYFTGMYDLRLPHLDTWTKITYPLIEYLGQNFNFTMEVYYTDSYGWQTNGTFDGVIGMMQREEIQIAASSLFMRRDRMPYVDFAAEAFYLKTAVVFRQPTLASVTNIFTLPFSTAVWACCVLLCVLTLLLFGLQLRLAARRGIEGELTHVTYPELFTFVLGSICQQGLPQTPTSLSGRVTVFVLALTSLFLFTSYSANIVALLQSPSHSIRSVSDLASSPLTLGVQDIAYNKVYLGETTDRELRQFVRRKMQPLGNRVYCNGAEGMERVRKGMFGFQVDTSTAYKIISETYTEREKCGLMEVNLFPLPPLCVATTKHAGYREMFSQRVGWQREVGILTRQRRLWLPQRPVCENMVSGFVSVGIMDFYPALLVLQYGIAGAIAVLALELLYFHRSRLWQRMRCISSLSAAKHPDVYTAAVDQISQKRPQMHHVGSRFK